MSATKTSSSPSFNLTQQTTSKKNLPHPRAYDFVIAPMEVAGASNNAIPSRLVLLRHDPSDTSKDQLFLDQLPIPREAWRYDTADRIISWRGAYGGGHLHVSHDGLGAYGNIGKAENTLSVSAGAQAVFDCDVALDVGATYVTSGGSVVGFTWDTTSAMWKNAAWIKQRLQLTYTVTPNGPILPPTFTFDFADNQTEGIPWDPTAFEASLSLGEKNGLMVWNLTFKSDVPPDPDQGQNPSTGPDTVFPYWMQAVEDAAAATISGVLQIDGNAPQGQLVGMQGVRATPGVAGYFKTASDAAPFAVFDSQLHVGGQAIKGSRVSGSTLSWSDLDPQHQKLTGLPASGTLHFDRNGVISANQPSISAQRLSTAESLAAITEHKQLHAELHANHLSLQQTLATTTLDMYGLLAMAPFVQNQQGAWGDAVQSAVTQDLTDIMNSQIPSTMWNLLFPSMPQPSLTGELAIVANSPVPGVTDPKAWYSSLATAVMTQGMANGSDENCKNMNGPRAAAWLKTQVATSPVYHTHGQILFNYEWQNRFNLTSQYLSDQISNSGTYSSTIDAQVALSVADINQNVVTDPTNPNLKTDLITQVQAVGAYAKTNQLYWAFAYFTYNTAPSILANIAIQMAINTGSSDGTTLSRLFQQNASVLTALDPSGYFAQQYTTTLNTFLATNILPSMFGFVGDPSSFDMIKEYLQQFVATNINNEDQQIAQAAAQIQSILNDENADQMLQDSIEALRAISGALQDTLALPYVANNFVKWFSTNYPKFSKVANVFGSLFIGGLTGMAIFSLFSEFKSWDKLNAAQKAQLILNTLQLGLQVVAAVVKRGVRIYSIFNVNGMTAGQRTAAISEILATGETGVLDQGLIKIGNTTARWLADTEGTIGKLAVTDQGVVTAVLVNSADAAAEEAGYAAKIFGKNLDEFIATRVGPIFILAGIGLSIYFISTGEGGLALASDILNIVGGSLMLFATIGGWAVEGGLIAAEGVMATIISVAGPLAILAALVGVGIMIYMMLKKPPNPVEEFVNTYVKPAGFYVPSQSSALDYAVPYANPDQNNLLMIGYSLSSQGSYLTANNDGSISLGDATALPNCVWQSTTDGLGMSKIITITQPDSSKPPVAMLLSLMSDNSISFQPAMPPPSPSPGQVKRVASAPGTGSTIVTQTWLSSPQSNAKLTSSGGFLASMTLKLQPVPPDSEGNYAPSQANGWMVTTSNGLGYNASAGSTFTLNMSGMAPNYMRMVDMNFLLNSTPSPQQSFGPTFGVYASTPATYALNNAVPAFLTFSADTGAFAPNGSVASPASQLSFTISASNALGKAMANFNLSVAAAVAPPTA